VSARVWGRRRRAKRARAELRDAALNWPGCDSYNWGPRDEQLEREMLAMNLLAALDAANGPRPARPQLLRGHRREAATRELLPTEWDGQDADEA
jgi:hypothetical protein